MSKGKILGMALEAIGKGADEVADVVKASKGAARKAVDAIADVGDDWGWKGGKPGEITGLDFRRQIRNADFEGNERKLKTIYEKARRQLSTNKKLKDSEVYTAMSQFSALERAGIPRKYTGKIYKAAGELISNPNANQWISHPKYIRGLTTENIAALLSDSMRPLSDKQRLVAVDLLPHWTRSLDDLGYAAREVETMTNDQREIFLSLLPEWTESLDDLADAARKFS